MGKKNKHRRQKLHLRHLDQKGWIDRTNDEIYSQDIRQEKAEEVKTKLSEFHIENFREIKKLFIILDLWVKHNREHQEIIDLSFTDNKKIEVRLFNQVDKECKVVIRHI